MILPKPMTYAQILAGAVSFQLYNKSTNAVVPTSISDGGGYIEITEDATSDHNTVYKIDQFNGAVSEITLYTEGDSAKTYALLGASFDENVHSVRTFSIDQVFGDDTYNFISVEIDGKMYLPGIRSESDILPVIGVNGRFEEFADGNYIEDSSVFPVIDVILEDDPSLGEGAIMKIPSFGNITTEARNCIKIVYKRNYDNDEPWRYGQDGIFFTEHGAFIRVNGINHLIVLGEESIGLGAPGASMAGDDGDIYTSQNPQLIIDCENLEQKETAKRNIEDEFGITFGEDILVADNTDGDNVQPFIGRSL